jgi:uncharacterized protein (TIGR02466 family)
MLIAGDIQMAESVSSELPTEIQATVRNYFATPVIASPLPDSEALNVQLREIILERERTSPSTEHSNLGGWQSTWDLAEWAGEPGRTVLNVAMRLGTRMTADRAGKPVKVNWKTNAWANINRASNGNEFHTHPGSYWSATDYVDDGGIADDPSLGGEFEIQDPRGVAPAMYAPLLAFAMNGRQSVGASELVHPKAGYMIMFPAWLSHGVRPYTGTSTRISIALNLSV